MTRAIDAAARTVGVVLHDHVIIGRERYTSFRSQGLL